MNHDIVLVRFGAEIGIKSRRTRQRMIAQLIKNLKRYFQDSLVKITNFRNRILIEGDDPEALSVEISRNIVGVASTSPVVAVESDFQTLIETGVKYAKDILPNDASFAIKARREGNHSYSSLDIARELGARILQDCESKSLTVNLNSPDASIYVEVRGEKAFFYTKKISGFGGYPVGVQGKVIGIIKPVVQDLIAAWLLARRGAFVVPIVFYTGNEDRIFLKDLEMLSNNLCLGISPISIPYTKTLETIDSSFGKDRCSACFFLTESLASHIASEKGLSGVVTGTSFDPRICKMDSGSLAILEREAGIQRLRPHQMTLDKIIQHPYLTKSNTCCSFCDSIRVSHEGMKKVVSRLEEITELRNELLSEISDDIS